MSAENYLTIRDYFDQLISGKQETRKAFSRSPGTAVVSGTGMFHRLLSSHQLLGVENADIKTTGMTIADYLANPVRRKSQYFPLIKSSLFEKKTVKSVGRSILAATKDLAAKATEPSPLETKHVPSTSSSAAISLRRQTGSQERLKIEKSIDKAASKYNLPPGLIKGVIRAESNFQVSAVSHAGAQGLMQLMPATAKELGVTDPFDIDQNIDGGSRYLRKMLDSFGGNVKLALTAYNAGPGTVRKYEGKVPYPETKQYIDRVLRFSKQTV